MTYVLFTAYEIELLVSIVDLRLHLFFELWIELLLYVHLDCNIPAQGLIELIGYLYQ